MTQGALADVCRLDSYIEIRFAGGQSQTAGCIAYIINDVDDYFSGTSLCPLGALLTFIQKNPRKSVASVSSVANGMRYDAHLAPIEVRARYSL